MLRKILLTCALISCSAAVMAANRPSGYVTICKVGQTCSVSQSTNVAFGASDKFVYKVLSGSFSCSVATFGSDPIPAKSVKECSIPSGTAGSSANSSTSSSASSSAAAVSTSLSANSGNGQVSLTWSIAGTVSGLEIYRDTDSNPSGRVRIASLSAATRAHTDTSVSNGTTYWYWVKAFTSSGSINSNGASATPSGGADSSSSSSSSSGSVEGSAKCVAGATFENTTVDCGGKTLGLSCPSDGEGQPPILTLKNATVKNLRIAASGGADGIHCTSGACRVENVVWEDICEDAASLLSSGTKLTIVGGSAYNSDASTSPGGKPDKIFQHNSKNSTFEILGGFTAKGVNGKLWRSCGDCSSNGGPRNLVIDNVRVEGKVGTIAGLNRNYGDKVRIRNLKIQGYRSGSPNVCEEWTGIVKGQGSTVKHGEFWNTQYCDVSRTDVTAF